MSADFNELHRSKAALFQVRKAQAWKHAPELYARFVSMNVAFATEKDFIAALWSVRIAMRLDLPLGPDVARWLDAGIGAYLTGKAKTLDDALGLRAEGRAEPRRKHAERVASAKKWQPILDAMVELVRLGATISEAAALAALRWPAHSADALTERYKRSEYAKKLKRLLGPIDPADPTAPSVEAVLREYPTPRDRRSDAAAAMRRLRKGVRELP